MANDEHPADQLAQTFHDLINGEGFKQTIRQAWDRITAPAPHPEESDTVKQMNKAAMDKTVQDANKTFITPDAAAKIRTAAKSMGGK